MIELRPYQLYIIEKVDNEILKGYTKILISSAPSSGKTLIYGRLITTLHSNSSTVIVPSTELKDQVTKDLASMGIVNTEVETIQKILNCRSKNVDLLIMDEGHRYQSPVWKNVTDLITGKYTIGLTATPFRTDHKPLLEENNGYFECIIQGPSIKELTEGGYAADIVYHTVPAKQIMRQLPIGSWVSGTVLGYIKEVTTEPIDLSDDVINQYMENFNGVPAIVFCRNISHTKAVASDFMDSGISSIAINGDMSKKECNLWLDKLRNNEVQVVAVCRKGNEGLNCPNLKVAIFLREFRSLVNYIQATGRVIRQNGQIAHVVDLTGNFYRFGTVEEAEEEGRIHIV